jgi:PAS domain-containing protein
MLEIELFDLLEGMSDAAFTVTNQREICSWNKAAEKLFGYSAAEALKKSCQSILQGLGQLGNEMCGEYCSIRHRAEKHLEIPNVSGLTTIRDSCQPDQDIRAIIQSRCRSSSRSRS